MRTIYSAHRFESGLALWAVVYASFKGNKKNVRWVLALVLRPCVVCRFQTEIKIKSEMRKGKIGKRWVKTEEQKIEKPQKPLTRHIRHIIA